MHNGISLIYMTIANCIFQAEAKKKLGNITVGRRPTRHLQNSQKTIQENQLQLQSIPITIQTTDNNTNVTPTPPGMTHTV